MAAKNKWKNFMILSLSPLPPVSGSAPEPLESIIPVVPRPLFSEVALPY